MLKRLSFALLASAALAAANSATVAAPCKPPDLPLASKESCVPQLLYGNYSLPQQPACSAPTISLPGGACGGVVVEAGQKKTSAPSKTADWMADIVKWFDDNFGDTAEPAVPDWLSSLNTFLEQIGDSIAELLNNLNQTTNERPDQGDILDIRISQGEDLRQMDKEWRDFWLASPLVQQTKSSEGRSLEGTPVGSVLACTPVTGGCMVQASSPVIRALVDSAGPKGCVANQAEPMEKECGAQLIMPASQTHSFNSPGVAQKKPAPPPSIVEVINMKRNGVPEAIILEQIRITGAVYSLTSDDIIYLHQGGASSQLLTELQRRQPNAAPVVSNVIYQTPQFMPPSPQIQILREDAKVQRASNQSSVQVLNQLQLAEFLPMPSFTPVRPPMALVIAQQQPEVLPMPLPTEYYLRTLQSGVGQSTSPNGAATGMINGGAGCQMDFPETGQTLPSGYYLKHSPQYIPSSPAFPLAKQLHLDEAARTPRITAGGDQPLDAEAFKLHAAQRFYEIGRECEDRGDVDMARNCYEEANRILPNSRFGEMASARLQDLKVGRSGGGVEETEEPLPAKDEANSNDSLEARRLLESHRMLQLGERLERSGDVENASRCYQDALVICPAGRYGQDALQRLLHIESMKARQLRSTNGGAEEQEIPPVSVPRPLTGGELLKREKAQALFLQGESLLQQGQYGPAYTLYQESHLTFPNSYYGMKAIERLNQIEARSEVQPRTTNPQSNDGGITPRLRRGLQNLLWFDEGW